MIGRQEANEHDNASASPCTRFACNPLAGPGHRQNVQGRSGPPWMFRELSEAGQQTCCTVNVCCAQSLHLMLLFPLLEKNACFYLVTRFVPSAPLRSSYINPVTATGSSPARRELLRKVCVCVYCMR